MSPTAGGGLERRWTPALPTDVIATLGLVSRGRGDTTCVIGASPRAGVWRATRTPDGPGTVWIGADGGVLVARTWGPGASWLIERAPVFAGGIDELDGFAPTGLVGELHHRFPALRLCATLAVWETLFPVVLEQKVTGLEAVRSYARLLRRFAEPAPGPRPGLTLPPDPTDVAGAPSHWFHAAGVERMRSDRLRRAAAYAPRLEEGVALGADAAKARLRVLPGLGEWTANEVSAVALGDADAVSVGDYHLKHQVSWALAGEPRGTDERLVELLEPYRPHRQRVIRLLGAAGIAAPRYGPRITIQQRW